MINIAIVDDEQDFIDLICSYITEFQNESCDEFSIKSFKDGDSIVESFNSQYDVIFMDIQMNFVDGLSAAKEIRQKDSSVIIIFTTSLEKYATRGYEVEAMDYLVKPISYFTFKETLKRALMRQDNRQGIYKVFKTHGGIKKVKINDIKYIESEGHNLRFYMSGDSFVTSDSMKNIEKELSPLNFFRCNKGLLVNLAFVDEIAGNECILRDVHLPIGRTRKKDFMEALLNYMSKVVM